MEDIVYCLRDRYMSLTDDPLISGMFDALTWNVKVWPVDKTNRWIGFIQGVLYSKGLIEIDVERGFTRPLFHRYYKENMIDVPESVKV